MMGRACGAIKARLTTALAPLALTVPAALTPAAPATAGSVAIPRLIAGVAEAAGARTAGLEIALAPGWKTYWRAPGDSGVPPLFDWAASENLAAVAVEWPAPEIFETFGFTTLGYGGTVTLPLRLTPVDAAQPIRLRLDLDYGVCAEICIPERAELALDIAPGAEDEGAAAIASARALAPTPATLGGVTSASCGLSGAGQERAFSARISFDHVPPAPRFAVVEGPDGVWFGPAATTLDGAAMVVTAEARLADPALWVGRDALRLTLFGAGLGAAGALEVEGCAARAG
jgi:DsbC/DsbD-like thiol-disulfide interchange protein